MRIAVADLVSPSYFVATAAVALGFFKAEGVDAEFVATPGDTSAALREGEIDFLGGSGYSALRAFPGWRGGRLLCALSHYTYWFLAVRADLNAAQGDVNAVKGLRISASTGPSLALRQLLKDAGIDPEGDGVSIVQTPHDPSGNWSRDGVRAIEDGLADGYWGNAMRAEVGVRERVAKVLLDVRRGDGPAVARTYTFPVLATSDRVVREHRDAAAGAVRAVVKTQAALRRDPSLATQAARRLFPAMEAGLIAGQVARDTPFYDARITPEMIDGATQFARAVGALTGEVAYEEAVATDFAGLWGEGQ